MKEGFRRFAGKVSDVAGSSVAFVIACVIVAGWAITGPLFHFSNSWQLVINTGTTICTFLMVFLLQATQNRDARALHLKLDELIRASKARNVFADLEHATDEELKHFQQEFKRLREQGVRSLDAAEKARKHAMPGHQDDTHHHQH